MLGVRWGVISTTEDECKGSRKPRRRGTDAEIEVREAVGVADGGVGGPEAVPVLDRWGGRRPRAGIGGIVLDTGALAGKRRRPALGNESRGEDKGDACFGIASGLPLSGQLRTWL